MAHVKAASSIFAALLWWHALLGVCALFLGQAMMLCAVNWPRSPTPGIELMRDIVIPLGFTLLACASALGGFMLLYTS